MSGLERVQILGTGGWGTAVAILLAGQDRPVSLWGRSPEFLEEMRSSGENKKYLPGVPIPEALHFGLDPDADLYVEAIPTQHIRKVLQGISLGGAPVISLSKGLEVGTQLRPTEIIQDVLGERTCGVLSGPSHGEEVARGLPATLVVASDDQAFSDLVQERFMGETFRVYTSTDVVGVELGGALKNVIAIAAGTCDGLGLGQNAKAALLTRGIVEIARLGKALGAGWDTFFGVSGIGDLITTCESPYGRNLRVGRELGSGKTIQEVLDSMAAVPEGVWTCRVALEVAREKGIDMPITEQVVAIIEEGKDPRLAVRDLMKRDPKPEREG